MKQDRKRDIGTVFKAMAALLAPLLLLGCIVPPTLHVIRPYNKIHALEGKRPRLYIRYRPMNYADHLVDLRTPGGRAYIDIGGALAESYREGFDGFFSVIRYMQLSDYVAKVDFSRLEVEVVYGETKTPGMVSVDVRIRHDIPIHFIFDNTIEEVVHLDVSAHSEVVASGDSERLALAAAGVIGGMLPVIEDEIFQSLLATDHEGKYVGR